MKSSSLLCLALMTPLAACGSDDGDGTVEGEHYRYVVSSLSTTSTNKLDLDGNGRTENKLGELLGSLAPFFAIQTTIDEALLKGTVLLLADLQTPSFSSAGNAGFSVYLGDAASVSPAPCTDVNVLTTCGQHLTGTGTFAVAATSPRDAQLTGPFAGGTMKAGPGKLSLQLALTGTPITVSLLGARAQISEASADGIERGIMGGGISQSELDTVLLPAVAAQMKVVIDRDCGPEAERMLGRVTPQSAEVCGRMTGGAFTACVDTGATLLGGATGFDTAPRDCKITTADLKASALLGQALTPDITIDGQQAVSAVIGFKTKKGAFTP